MDSYREIENLIYKAALVTDERGSAACCREVFTHCLVCIPDSDGKILGADLADDADKMLKKWGADGSLKTLHRVSNVLIEVDEEADSARSTSYLMMLQAVPESGFPLQPIGSGIYHDTFKRVDGTWQFATHRLELKLVGDMSRHAAVFDELPLWQLVIYKLTMMFPFLQRFMP